MIKNKEALADRLKGIKVNGEEITPEKLFEIMADNKSEVEVSVEPLHILDDTKLNDLKSTVKKTGYEEGKVAGSEMQMKKLKEITGIEMDGFKDPDKFMAAYKEKILTDAKVEPEKKVKELTESLTKLQDTLKQKETDWSGLLQQKDQTIKSIRSESMLMQSMPKVDGYKTNHLLAAFKSDGYSVDFDESNNISVALNGKVLKDQYEKTIPLDKVFSEWLQGSGFSATSTGGRGDGSHFHASTSEFKTEVDMFKHMEQNKIDPASQHGKEIMEKFYAKK